jgi:dTMP kinase
LRNGYLITIEGIEGAGKSTAIKHIKRILQKNNIESVFTREPGGTDNAEKIRDLLLNNNLSGLDSTTELMLMFASRNEHVKTLIIPKMEEGKVVVSDRFYDATYAYQGGGRNIDITLIDKFRNLVLGDFEPNLTILLDVPIEISMARISKRKELDRIENEDARFFSRVREQYLKLARTNSRFVVIDGSQSLYKVKSDITNAILQNIAIDTNS